MELETYFDRIYSDYDKYLVVPVAMILLAVAVLGFNLYSTGEILQKGVDFTGGTEIRYSVANDATVREFQVAFQNGGRADASAVKQVSGNDTYIAVTVPPPDISQEEASQIINDANLDAEVASFRSISSSVSSQFFIQAQLAFLMAFTIMSLVIFVAFKDVVPSLAVIFAATGDVLFAAAGMSLLGIPLTLGSLAALLMLIGYSVDTDIVLSTRVLKRNRGDIKDRVWSSVKTGVTMSSGGIAGFIILYTVSYLIVGPSELSNIAAVMVIGLLADMPLTWLGNAIVLKKYVEGDYDGFLKKFEVFN